MIKGVGCDIINIERIEKIYQSKSEGFIERILADTELKIFEEFTNHSKKMNYLAKRFAAKESVAKAMGKGFGSSISFKDIAILNNSDGQPYVVISENIKDEAFKTYKFDISISDDWPFAVAFVVISI